MVNKANEVNENVYDGAVPQKITKIVVHSFEQRIKVFSEKLQAETGGVYSLVVYSNENRSILLVKGDEPKLQIFAKSLTEDEVKEIIIQSVNLFLKKSLSK